MKQEQERQWDGPRRRVVREIKREKRKEKRKIKEQKRDRDKMVDVLVMECQRGISEGEDGSTTSTDTPTKHNSSKDASSAVEAQKLADNFQQFEDATQEAGQEEERQQDEGNNGYGTDTEMPPLVKRHRDDASSDDSTSDGSYKYHTDNDNSSIEGNDDEGSNTASELQRSRDGCSSEVPQCIGTRPIIPPWMYSVDKDDYKADRDDNVMSTRERETLVPLRIRGGGGVPVMDTVTDEDTGEGIEELEHPPPSQTPIIPPPTTTITTTTTTPQQPKYDPMKDETSPATVTPSYVPLWKKNEH